MYALSLGISQVNPILPDLVYALLSGQNASTVGIVALAAVQLARKAITDGWWCCVVRVGGYVTMRRGISQLSLRA